MEPKSKYSSCSFGKFQVLQALWTRESVGCFHKTPTTMKTSAQRWSLMGCSLAHTHTHTNTVQQSNNTDPNAPPPTHALLRTDLVSFTHSHPTHPAPFLLNDPPQLQEIPNDHHRPCAVLRLLPRESAHPRTYTTNAAHISERRDST